jgi:RNA polymerase sigma-70 factor (ECF subfamily)
MNEQTPNTNEVLLDQIAAGSEKAFRTLFDIYKDRLYIYINGFVKSPQVAEELVLDVFMKLWLGRDLLGRIKNFDGFLFRVAHNKSIDILRAAAKDSRLKELLWQKIQAPSDLLADRALIHHEFEDKLREAIDLLSPQRKKIYKLSTEQDLTHDEIAVELNISKSTVNNHIVEARRFIRDYLSINLDIAMLLLIIAEF